MPPKAKQKIDNFLEIAFPSKGKDTSLALSAQPPGTMVDCINCRVFEADSDRQRGASRPGMSKYCPTQLTVGGIAAPIQDLNSVVISRQSSVVSGNVLTRADGSPSDGKSATILSYAAGAEIERHAGATTENAVVGCFDEDSNAYKISYTASTIQIWKWDSAGTTVSAFPVQTLTPTFGAAGIYGVAAREDILYVYLTKGATQEAGIFRFNASTGVTMDSGAAWVSAGLACCKSGTYYTWAKLMDISNGVLGILGEKSSTTVFQQVNGSGAIVYETTIDASTGRVTNGITADTSGNFYVAYYTTDKTGDAQFANNYDGAVRKINSVGSISWTTSFLNYSGGTGTPQNIAYDAFNSTIWGVGANLNNTANRTLVAISPGAGAITNPTGSSYTTDTSLWDVAADGKGGFVTSKKTTAGTQSGSTVRKLNSSAVSQWTYSPLDQGTGSGTGDPTDTALGVNVASSSTVSAGGSIMQSTRSIRGLVVAGGSLSRFSGSVAVSLDASFLSAGVNQVFSTQLGEYVYYTDGTSPLKKYSTITQATAVMAATAGSLPGDTATGEKPRLVCTWGKSLLWSGLRTSPFNWFRSAQTDAENYNYGNTPILVTQACAGNASTSAPCGEAPDIVNALIPWNNDVVIFGGDHSFYILNGNPMQGGRFDKISEVTGIAWGRAWCQHPDGTIFFFATRGGVFTMVPGQPPQRLSQQVSDDLADVDVGSNNIRMVWDDRSQGFHLFISPFDVSVAAQHWFWESRTNAWMPFEFGYKSHNPLAVAVFDGDAASDRVILIGGRDGYIRQFDNDQAKDDSKTINWSFLLGPIISPDLSDMLLRSLQGELGADSGDASYEILSGNSAEEALSATPRTPGTWKAGRNPSDHCRVSGYAIYIRVFGTSKFAFERARMSIEAMGKIRMRGV